MDRLAARLPFAMLGVVVLYALLVRVYLAWLTPLWIDESWTAVVSTAHSPADWAHQVWLDSNPPLYYLLIWLWPFESDFGLKLPSILMTAAAGALAGFWRPNSISRQQGMFWAGLLVLWSPGMSLFADARYYALLLLVSTGQTIAFVRLLEAPSSARAFLWTGLATLAILTHYFAAFPAMAQGLILLWRLRARVLHLLPSGILVVPAFLYLAWHYPRLRLYSQYSWYETLDPSDWPRLLLWPISENIIGAILILTSAFMFRQKMSFEIKAAAIASGCSLLFFVILGSFFPMVMDRYMIPMVPGLLLMFAAGVRPVAVLAILTLMLLFQPLPNILRRNLFDRAWFGLELPARHVPATARSVSWTIVFNGSNLLEPDQMRRMLADAFARNNRAIVPLWRSDRADARIVIARDSDQYPAGCLVNRRRGTATAIC